MKHLAILITITLLYTISGYGQTCGCTSGSGCSIIASQPYNDTAKGDYSIFYGNSSNQLINPIIIVEGLDVSNSFSCQDFYYSGVPTTLNSYGFDVVFLNLHNNLGYVQSNAFLIMTLINQINSQIVGTNKLIVAGINTGAIEARYALSYMEANNMNHNTKCFISIDGAQRGMNVPLSLQVWLDQVAEDGITIGISNALSESEIFQNPIFQQLLYCDHDKSISNGYPSPSNSYVSFFNELRSLTSCYGYPEKCQKIAISNGAIDGSSQIRFDGTRANTLDMFFAYYNNTTNTPIVGLNSGAPNAFSGWVYADPDTIVRGLIASGGTEATVAVADFVNQTGFLWGLRGVDSFRAYDVCPGSYSEFVAEAANEVATYVDSFQERLLNTTFIPTISAFDINTENLYFDFQSNWPVEGTISPFDKCYALGSYAYGGNGDANYIDYYDLFNNTDILTQIANSDSYTACSYTDLAIPPTTLSAGSSQSWRASQYITVDSLVVDSGASANITAGEAVIISPGTTLGFGSNVTIEIKPCSYNVCTPPMEKVGRIPISDNNTPPSDLKTANNGIQVYPNPTSSTLNIKLPANPDNNAKILIYNDEGIIVKQFDARQIQLQINVIDLTDGIYLLSYKSNNTYASKKFTVAKY